MPCTRPLVGRRNSSGQVVPFQPDALIGSHQDPRILIPCGRCTDCRLERARQWAVRIMHESQLHEENSFITLTYDDEHLPTDGSLDLRHWKLFAKRMRQREARAAKREGRRARPFRYFHSGEYTDNWRPHYHAILFGRDFHEDREYFKNGKCGDPVYTSEELEQCWGMGYVTVGDVTFESAAYVARYAMKKITGDAAADHYKGRKPEYVTMSRRPGIAKDWFDQFSEDVWKGDHVVMRGHAARPPKYYDDQMHQQDAERFEAVKTRRRERQEQRGRDTPSRLSQRAKCTQARHELYSNRNL